MMDLSIIIVNYNTKDLLDAAIRSVISNPPSGEFEIIVVDNASTDGSKEYLQSLNFKRVTAIFSNENLGFSKANNLGLKKALGRYILFLNPDTRVLPHTLEECLQYMKQHPETGVLGCRVLLENGELDLACRRSFPTLSNTFFRFTHLSKLFPNSRIFAQYNLTFLPEDQIYPVDCLVGAFMMVPKAILKECGSFDEDYFMYGEDIDLCYRIRMAGYQNIYFGTSSIIHCKRASSKKSVRAKETFYESMLIYYQKHHQDKHGKLVSYLVKAGVWIVKKLNL